MKLRGNFKLLSIFELVTGILTFVFCYLFGDIGLIALLLYFIGMIITLNLKPDEREIQLILKADNFTFTLVIILMGIIYFNSIPLNWYHVLVSSALFTRGSLGLYFFIKE